MSTQKFLKMSPTKLRFVADSVRGKNASEVLEVLPFVQKEAASAIRKVVRAAVAGAVEKGANPSDLVVKSIEINEGPKLKRFRPVSRGQAHAYVRKLSHIKVVVHSADKLPVAKKETVEKKTKVLSKKK
jgi:large subunit ribosomal protein L22